MWRILVGSVGSASGLGVWFWIVNSGRVNPIVWIGFAALETVFVALLVSGLRRLSREPGLSGAILLSQRVPLEPLAPDGQSVQIPVRPVIWSRWLAVYGLSALLSLGLAASEAKEQRAAGVVVAVMVGMFCLWRIGHTWHSRRRYSPDEGSWIRADENGITIPLHIVKFAGWFGRLQGTRRLRWEEIDRWQVASVDEGPGIHRIFLRPESANFWSGGRSRTVVLIRSRIQGNRALLDAVRSLGRKAVELADDVAD